MRAEPKSEPIARVLWAKPFAGFWINGRFEADENGVVDVSEADDEQIAVLLASGCRERK